MNISVHRIKISSELTAAELQITFSFKIRLHLRLPFIFVALSKLQPSKPQTKFKNFSQQNI